MSAAREWRFSQCFGETGAQETEPADILSAVEFSHTGKYLATGDKGGRIVVFETDVPNDDSYPSSSSRPPGPMKVAAASSPPISPMGGGERKKRSASSAEYRFYCEFQSHEPEFDYLKSLEIEEKINQIKWCPPAGGSLYLLSTNDKTIRLWRVFEKELKVVAQMNVSLTASAAAEEAARPTTELSIMGPASLGMMTMKSLKARQLAAAAAVSSGAFIPLKSPSQLVIPKLLPGKPSVTCVPRRTFANAHAYHINSVSVNSDGCTFLSADDLRVNLWNLNRDAQAFNIVDIKPENMEDLTEVITACEFHPSHCNTFAYSNSRGAIKLGDMRRSALCDIQSKVFEEEEQPGEKSFFSEIIASVSDIKFTSDGRYIVARDYLTLKIWDVKMESRPVKTIKIHEHLRPKLCDLYEDDCIFDKFECVTSSDGKYFATGSYHNYLHIFDRTGRNDVCIEASSGPNGRKSMPVAAAMSPPSGGKPTTTSASGAAGKESSRVVTDPAQIDFSRKAMNLAWHPEDPTIAVCCANNLYIYTSLKSSSSSSSSGASKSTSAT